MSCKCRDCRQKLAEAETYRGNQKKGGPQQNVYGQNQRHDIPDVYGSGSSAYSHINVHAQNERHRSGDLNPRSIVSAKPVSHISDSRHNKKKEVKHDYVQDDEEVEVKPVAYMNWDDRPVYVARHEPERKVIRNSNSAILETGGGEMLLMSGQCLRFNKGISGSDNSGNFSIGPDGDTITFKTGGMYRFVFSFAVEDSAPNSIYIYMTKTDPNHANFQTLNIYNDGVNSCSTMLPVNDNTEVKFRHPGKGKPDIKFVGPVRLELYEV